MFNVKGDVCMKKTILIVIVALFAVSMAFTPLAMAGPQQDKMTVCNKEAAEKKLIGEERNKFMSDCLKTKPVRGEGDTVRIRRPVTPPIVDDEEQEQIEACKKEANEKELKGEAHKKFMYECLKAKPALTPQQDKMKACKKEATEKKLTGKERKAFMKECLKTKPVSGEGDTVRKRRTGTLILYDDDLEKIEACDKEAVEKKLTGVERRKFVKECFNAKYALTPQQEKMKACNKEANEKKLKGEARKKFMSECLSAK